MIIIENWLEKDLCNFLEKKLLYETPHYYSQKSYVPGDKSKKENSNRFYRTDLNQQDNLMEFLINKLKKI